MTDPPAAVHFENVSKRYGDVTAVDKVTFSVEAGTLVTLLGPSGCGKTTTLRMIAGLEFATEGRITIGERDVTHVSATDRDVTMVFQSYALFPHMSVLDNVMYGLKMSGQTPDEARPKASEALCKVGLDGYGGRFPKALSGGQQQRVAVARALVLEPSVLLFDEPLSNLDAKLRRKMREDIRALQQELGVTAVYVTHDQEEALAVSDEIIVMNQGAIAQQGAPRALYEKPSSLFIATFIGDANILDGDLTAANIVELGDLRFPVEPGDFAPGPVTVAVRPNVVRIGAPGEAGLVGTIESATYVGTHVEYTVSTRLGALFVVDDTPRQPLAPGAPVSLQMDPDALILVPSN